METLLVTITISADLNYLCLNGMSMLQIENNSLGSVQNLFSTYATKKLSQTSRDVDREVAVSNVVP
jgi:hypothetical protein